MSSSSGSAPPAASRCCRSRRPASRSSASRRAPSLTRRDFAPDEIRNNVRDWPMAVQKANGEVPTSRATASSPTTRGAGHPMMNGVGGTSLHYWAQSWRLNPWDFKVVSETRRRYGASRIPEGLDGRGLAVRSRGARAVLRQGRVRSRRLGAGRQRQRQDRSEGQHLRRPSQARLPDAAAALDRLPREDGRRRAARSAGIRLPVRRPSTTRPYQDRSACMYHGFCNRGGCHVDAKNSTAVTTIPRAEATGQAEGRDARHVTTIESDAQGRVTGVNYLVDGTEYFQPAKVVLLASYTYENTRLLLLSKSQGVSQRPVEQPRTGGAPLLQPSPGRGRLGAVSVQSPLVVRPARAGRGRRQLRRRQLRPLGPGLHRRRQPLGLLGPASDRRRRHEHLGPGARVGLGVEGVHQGERRSLEQRPTSRRRRCRTRTTTSISIRS